MDLSPYIDTLRNDLAVAAEAGGEDSRQLADRLTAPLEPAVRLVLLDALSAAAGEISRELAPGSVDLRLRGGEPEFAVTPPPPEELTEPTADPTQAPPATPAAADAEEGAMTRINLRLPEQLKAEVEQAASRERLSVNAWLVRVVAATLAGPDRDAASSQRGGRIGRAYTGWVS